MGFDLIAILTLALILAGTGCIAGVLTGPLGVGGGIIMVPVLFMMLGFSRYVAGQYCVDFTRFRVRSS